MLLLSDSKLELFLSILRLLEVLFSTLILFFKALSLRSLSISILLFEISVSLYILLFELKIF